MIRMQYVAVCTAAWALLAAPAHAQQRRTGTAAAAQSGPLAIRVGQTVNGTLTRRDPRMSDKGRFHVYRFAGRQGQTLIATLRSGDFDAYLTVARTVSGITDAIASDDDRGGGAKNTDSRARFTIPADGSYLIVAQALDTTGVGAYTLSLSPAPVPTTSAARPVRVGQTVTGRLAETDAVLEEDDSYYDTWTVSARKGQRLQIEMRSDSIDTFLNLGKMNGREFTSLKTDDDGAGGGTTNSRLLFTVPDDGEYVIRANEVGTKTGPYSMSITEREPGPTTATPHPIEPNQQVNGELNDQDPQGDDDSYYDYWTYQGRAGERVKITMASQAFDTYVSIGTLDGTAYHELASNDDGTDGTNSLLEFTLPSSGTFVIRAKALSGDNQGPYTLKVEPQH